jgi:polar amino acid transport system substrate-binding protein
MKKLVIVLFISFGLTSLFADKLSEIQKKGTLTIGIQNDFEHLSFKGRAGEVIGFNIDFAEYIAKELKVKYKFKSGINKANIVKNINNNNIDIAIAPITHTTKLDKKVDFSISYFYNGQTLLIGKRDNAKDYKDFSSKKVATVDSKRGATFNVINPLSEIVKYSSYSKATSALKAKKVAAITGDYATLSRLETRNKTKLKLISKPFTVEPYGILLRENQSNLRDELNRIIQKSLKTGEYQKIYKKWFSKAPFI